MPNFLLSQITIAVRALMFLLTYGEYEFGNYLKELDDVREKGGNPFKGHNQ